MLLGHLTHPPRGADDFFCRPGGTLKLLDRYPELRSTVLDEVRAQVGGVFCEHDLRLVGPAQALDTRLCYRSAGPLSFGRLQYGAAVDIDPGALGSFFLLQMPTRGHETIMAGNRVVLSTATVATIVSPSMAFRMHHGQGTEKLFIRIERAALERQFTHTYARPPRGAIEFLPDISAPLAQGTSLRRMIDWLFAEASDGALLEHPLVAAHLQEALLTALLQGLPHNQANALHAKPATVSPRFVLRALAYIDQHAHEPLTATSIAAQVGVSARSLFAGFRKYQDTTPMACLKGRRLDLAQADLVAAPAARGHVTRTALRCGFSHFGQFSAAYERRFGELPSQTVARAAKH